jgi:hypothetical protein
MHLVLNLPLKPMDLAKSNLNHFARYWIVDRLSQIPIIF